MLSWCCDHLQCEQCACDCALLTADEYLADFTMYKPGSPDSSVFDIPELCAVSNKSSKQDFPVAALQMSMLLPLTCHSESLLHNMAVGSLRALHLPTAHVGMGIYSTAGGKREKV